MQSVRDVLRQSDSDLDDKVKLPMQSVRDVLRQSLTALMFSTALSVMQSVRDVLRQRMRIRFTTETAKDAIRAGCAEAKVRRFLVFAHAHAMQSVRGVLRQSS